MEQNKLQQVLKQQLKDKNPHKMENLTHLPKLGDRRLCFIHQKVSKSRKNIIVHNEKMKMRGELDARSLEKTHQVESYLGLQRSLPVKRSLLELRGIQKCLKRKREATSLTKENGHLYGKYDGESLRTLKPEVQAIIHHMHPRERRWRLVEQMKVEGKTTGRLVDYDVSLDKFKDVIRKHEDFLHDSFTEMREKKRLRERAEFKDLLPQRNLIGRDFHLPAINIRSGTNLLMTHKPSKVRLTGLSSHARKVIQGELDLQPVVPRADTLLT